jgi:hypothetical protein
MKTMAQFIQGGIATLPDLKDALQLAMQLEFSTIPPYLCAEWSVDTTNSPPNSPPNTPPDPSGVGQMINKIVEQEMFHFALAANLLAAIGGVPAIADASFVLPYPTHYLPGKIYQLLAVDLQPLSIDQLQVFMQIEFPEFTPVALVEAPPTSIGAFYTRISEGFTNVNPTFVAGALAVAVPGAAAITDMPSAQAAITRIKEEGEGTTGSPDQPPADILQFAHYYVFKEIYEGKTLVPITGGWNWGDPPIILPAVYNFAPSNASPDQQTQFNQTFTTLLKDLQTCWTTSGTPPNVGAMENLRGQGIALIKQGIRPNFIWTE